MCAFCKDNDIPLYVTLAKLVGTAREQADGCARKLMWITEISGI